MTLGNLSPKSKALAVVSEFQQQTMDLSQLKALFQELCPKEPERHTVAIEIEEALRQAKYPPAEIWKLLDAIYPERTSGAHAAAPKPQKSQPPHHPTPVPVGIKPAGKRTQPVKSPFIKSFENFKFEDIAKGQPPQTQKPSGTIAGAPPGANTARTPTPPPLTKTSRHQVPHPGPEADKLPHLKDTDKTAFFGAALKGITVNAVRPQTKARILVADDDQRIRFVYRTKLEENGYTVIEAENGMEAWRIIQTGEADIAILDMKMPGYHGLDILSRMADAGMSIPVVISTAYDQLADEFVVATYPRLKYLVKPIDPNELLRVVNEFVIG
ncbi:MAG TPA: response regulator [Planctomycetes bacterium]|nr:response regulator [Planctomycetota bacterium]